MGLEITLNKLNEIIEHLAEENQKLEEELIETKIEIEKLRTIIRAYKNGDHSN